MTKPMAKKIAAILLVTSLAGIIAFAISFRLEVAATDYLLTTYGKAKPAQNIVIVTIDENTLATLPYRSPIDRAFLSKLIQKIDQAGAKAIGLDLLIDQPSETQKDQTFLTTLKNLKTPIVIGYATKAEGLTPKQIAFENAFLKTIPKGLVTLLRDNFDGTVRQTFSGRMINGKWQPGLAAALAKVANKQSPLPTGRITYYNNNQNKKTKRKGLPFSFPSYPAHTVQFLPAQWFKDKIVLIGPALPAQDRHATPFTTTKGTTIGNLYGVTIHANILSQFLNGDQITPTAPLATIAIVLGLSLIASLIATLKISPLKRTILTSLLILAFSAVAIYLFINNQIQIPIATPILATVFSSLFFALRQWFKDREQRQFIEQAFSQYVSPAIVAKIIANHERLELGGELRQVTYIFTDLKNFTALCEGLEPPQIAELLNDYLDKMCTLFVEAEATIDKIIGDAVVGFFGAPEPQQDQAERAVQLALKIDQFSQKYCAELQAKNIAFGLTRIGVHKGNAVIGNFGGKRFMDYTGIGDTVNTAARLESANKTFGTRICVSQTVMEDCSSITFRPIGDIILKGKTQPISCYEPLAPTSNNQQQATQQYNKAYTLMANQDNKAVSAFSALKNIYPNDGLINFHATRLHHGERGAIIEMKNK